MKIDFSKTNGLVPVIIQDERTLQVLMLGFMNEEAFSKTKEEGIVTFFSRSKDRLWTKGEESGNFLSVKNIEIDCDQDTILIKAIPTNTVCHTGSFSCFGQKDSKGFLYELEEKINQRIDDKIQDSYTYYLYQKGINKVAQKVGEEAVELVIEAKDDNENLFKNEAADLLYHFLILLKAKNIHLADIEETLLKRNK
ncbi:bifunctional phosphoribosyl-AMP cyclohydrolase/phosphoribosyl-ATP diphosphatase HisIE [Chryseobacterium indoltheticum]|uniref:Histidine biosynthesis bifunctional protein HisIE n=1 Tax=Chryseobacterium indoltheticum TaxID=254 RepID=A0A381FC72_9FLAO|nr:bifunctional phosphoribosyl-AMP cyclohydrolase/phosphoribosyl-ATP diphosphatase HisIE [Chryseobacterium indoltheticum]AZA59894.1 bifunctional phosphoribosyl-AMP cyclohydrolase/phosphoribosyl-ATP diphosphatase HisIE [Chryseobacterium indoltheticum]SUX43672.1 Phosphoribosyl-ATP pyrophosphatase [Chryseobacterium indoltheticum]